MSRKQSNYSRKHEWCSRNGAWGFEVPEPKPWKRGASGEASIVQSNQPCRYAEEVALKIAAVERSWDRAR